MSRPFKTDTYLSAIIHQFIEKTNSITKIITFKPFFKDLYVKNREHCKEEIEISTRIRDMAYAPQRYHSECSVIVRSCITFDAVMVTAAQVIAIRGATSPEGAACVELFSFATPEVGVQLGMLGDASFEMYRLVSFLDTDGLDEGEALGRIEHFEAVTRRLFIDGQCLHTPGLTGVMLRTMGRARTHVISGKPVTLGNDEGVSNDIKTRCCQRMANWVHLTTCVIAAEFPTWDLLASFKVFALDGKKKVEAAAVLSDQSKDLLCRLAQVIGLRSTDLISEFANFEPMATKLKATNFDTNLDAWAAAIARTSSRSKDSAEALIQCLARYGAWTSSESNVERGFARSLAVKQCHSEDTFTSREEDIVILQCDPLTTKEEEELIVQASRLWMMNYGRTRNFKQERGDAGLPRKKQAGGEKGYKQRLAAINDSLVGHVGELLPKRRDLDNVDSITDKQVKEIEFNDAKENTSKIEALLAGHLLEHEIDEQLLADAEKHVLKIGKAQSRLASTKAATKRKVVDKPVHDVSGANVYIDSACDNGFPDRVLANLGVQRATTRALADLFIVPDPCTAQRKIRVLAALSGGILATPEYLRSGGKKGAAIAYKAAVATKRNVYLTAGFMNNFPSIASDLYEVLQQTHCQWKLTTEEAIHQSLNPANRGHEKRQRECIVFMSQAEYDAQEPWLQHRAHVHVCMWGEWWPKR